jgi:sugar phosphate isomerase/epimerase
MTSSWGSRTWVLGTGSFFIRDRSILKDCCPIWKVGWRMVVSLGVRTEESAISSKPATAQSCGTRRPASCSGLHYIIDGTLRLLSQEPEMMKKSVDYLNKVVDLAADFEAPTVIVGSGGITRNFEPGWDRPKSIACMQEVLHTVGDHAREKGVVLAVEAINRYETQFLKPLPFVLQNLLENLAPGRG